MCMIEQMISVVPMVGPMVSQVSAYTAPVVDGLKALIKPAVVLAGVLAVTACSSPSSNVPDKTTALSTGYYTIRKMCDEGRAVYTVSGGITVVENAHECPQPKGSTTGMRD